MYKKTADDDSKDKTSTGLDTDIDTDTALAVIKSAEKFKGSDIKEWRYYQSYGFKTVGGNHKGKAMKAALALMPTCKLLFRQEVKVFWGLTVQQQRKVCVLVRRGCSQWPTCIKFCSLLKRC